MPKYDRPDQKHARAPGRIEQNMRSSVRFVSPWLLEPSPVYSRLRISSGDTIWPSGEHSKSVCAPRRMRGGTLVSTDGLDRVVGLERLQIARLHLGDEFVELRHQLFVDVNGLRGETCQRAGGTCSLALGHSRSGKHHEAPA